MKRTYEAPVMCFEDFELSANIAAGCTAIITGHTQNTCALDFGGQLLFIDRVTACKDPIIDDGSESSFCYHIPIADNKLFNS